MGSFPVKKFRRKIGAAASSALGIITTPVMAAVLAGVLTGCGGSVSTPTVFVPPPSSNLSAAEVTALVQAAAVAADPNTMVIAVVDRAGRILAVYRKPAAPTLATGNFGAQVDTNELAVSLARTAAFFSNDQAPLSSRTVRFISGIHFPPGISTRQTPRSTESRTPIAVALSPRISSPARTCRPRVRSTALRRAWASLLEKRTSPIAIQTP